MSPVLRIFLGIAGLFLIVQVLRAIVYKKLQERQSLFWILTGLLFIIVSIFPGLVYLVSDLFGVKYAPSMVFALALLVNIFGLFQCFKTNCQLEKQVSELARMVSLLNQEKTQDKES